MTDDPIARALAGIRNCRDHAHWTGERLDGLVERVVRDLIRTSRRPQRKLPPEIAALFGSDEN